MSNPRAAKSVASSNFVLPVARSFKAFSRRSLPNSLANNSNLVLVCPKIPAKRIIVLFESKNKIPLK